jgi:hypothetical protein
MDCTTCIILGTILFILIILATVLGRAGLCRSTFCASPAPPSLIDRVNSLYATIDHLIAIGRGAPEQTPRAHIDRLALVEHMLTKTPPTRENYAAIYRGLSGSDGALLAAAAAYDAAAQESFQRARNGAPNSAAEIKAGRIQTALGNQTRRVVQAIRELGAALAA